MAFSFFFRDYSTLQLTVGQLVPRVIGKSRIRVWDAGCSTGEEAYSLAILLTEGLGPHAASNLRIDATDREESDFPQFERAIDKAAYHRTNVEHVPTDLFEKYFVPADEPEQYEVIKTIRGRVHYQRHDLRTMVPIGEDFSLVMCKNVLMHLLPEERIGVVKMFCRSLLPGGVLAMEQTQGLPAGTEPLFESLTTEGRIFAKSNGERGR